MNTGFEEIKKQLENSQTLLQEIDEFIPNLQYYMGDDLLEKYTEGFLKNFRKAKKELRLARQTLFSLAEQTKAKGKIIEIMIDNWDGQSKAILKRTLRTLSALLRISLTKLEAAKATYNTAIDTFEESDDKGEQFKQRLDHILRTKQDDYAFFSQRLSYISSAVGSALCLFLDVLVSRGLCTTVIAAPKWASTVIYTEIKVGQLAWELKDYKILSRNFINKLSELDEYTDNAVKFLEKEIQIIIEWEANARNSGEIIDDFTEEEIEEYNGYQYEIRSSMIGLMEAVQKFLQQPKHIFG